MRHETRPGASKSLQAVDALPACLRSRKRRRPAPVSLRSRAGRNPWSRQMDRPQQTTAAESTCSRRDALKLAGATLASAWPLAGVNLAADSRPRKRILIAGGGIGGLCCAFELMDRGHDVTVLEASGRPGGHVKTIHDPLPDGLYADVGAEHFGKPDYVQYRKYVDRFQLPYLAYPPRHNMLRRIAGQG